MVFIFYIYGIYGVLRSTSFHIIYRDLNFPNFSISRENWESILTTPRKPGRKPIKQIFMIFRAKFHKLFLIDLHKNRILNMNEIRMFIILEFIMVILC